MILLGRLFWLLEKYIEQLEQCRKVWRNFSRGVGNFRGLLRDKSWYWGQFRGQKGSWISLTTKKTNWDFSHNPPNFPINPKFLIVFRPHPRLIFSPLFSRRTFPLLFFSLSLLFQSLLSTSWLQYIFFSFLINCGNFPS